MKNTVDKTINWVYKNYLEPYVQIDNQGKFFINEDSIEKLASNQLERNLVEKILQDKNITIIETITKNERPTRVSDFSYGNITEVRHNSVDAPTFAKLDYDHTGEIKSEDYTELDKYLEDEFIPANVEIKTLDGDKHGEPYLAIQLNKIVKARFSEAEITHILEYLKKQGIKVRGISEDLEYNDNYDYHYRLKNIQTPKRISSQETLEEFKILNEYRKRAEKLKQELEKIIENENKIEIENELKQIENKCQEIIEKIENGNAKLAEWVLYKCYKAYGLNFNEWKVIAYEGLFQAIKKFDVEKGFQFSTFAVKVIRNYIEGELANYYEIDQNDFSLFWRAMRVIEEVDEKKYEPGNREMLEEILNLLEYQGLISPTTKEKYMKKSTTFLEDEIGKDNIPYDEEAFYKEMDYNSARRSLEEVLNTLTEREAEVLKMRYGLENGIPATLEDTGKHFEVTRERIRQIEAKALRKLRHPSRSKKISTYLYEPTIKNNNIPQPRNSFDIIRKPIYKKENISEPDLENIEILKKSTTEPSDLLLAIEKILKGKKYEIPSEIIKKIEKEIDKLPGKIMIEIVKLRLGFSEFNKKLSYEEIGNIIKQDESTVYIIMKNALEILSKRKLPQEDTKEISQNDEGKKEEVEQPVQQKIDIPEIVEKYSNSKAYDLITINNLKKENEEPSDLLLAIEKIIKGKKDEVLPITIAKINYEIDKLEGSVLKKIVKSRLGIGTYSRPLEYEELSKITKFDEATIKSLMKKTLRIFSGKSLLTDEKFEEITGKKEDKIDSSDTGATQSKENKMIDDREMQNNSTKQEEMETPLTQEDDQSSSGDMAINISANDLRALLQEARNLLKLITPAQNDEKSGKQY